MGETVSAGFGRHFQIVPSLHYLKQLTVRRNSAKHSLFRSSLRYVVLSANSVRYQYCVTVILQLVMMAINCDFHRLSISVYSEFGDIAFRTGIFLRKETWPFNCINWIIRIVHCLVSEFALCFQWLTVCERTRRGVMSRSFMFAFVRLVSSKNIWTRWNG